MANADEWKTVLGEAFKIDEQDDKTKFTVKSYQSGAYINCTLWHNSHGHLAGKIENGDSVIVNGKFKKEKKKEGEGFWLNISVKRIAILAMDAGVRDDAPESGDAGDDEPDVL